MLTVRLSWLRFRYIHTSSRLNKSLSISSSEYVKRDNVIRSFLNGWSWNEHPNIILHRKLISADHCKEWIDYSERFPYVIDYQYTMYHQGLIHRGTFVFSNAIDQLLLVESLSVASDQLSNGGSSKTRQKSRTRKRKTLRDRVQSLAQLIHYSNVNIQRTEGVMVTDNDIEHLITLPGHTADSYICQNKCEGVTLSDDKWRHSYWPRDTSQLTCIGRDKVLRTYFTQCDWSNNPEFNIIRQMLLNYKYCIDGYPLFYDYQYLVPLESGGVCEGDCIFTDGSNSFMVVEVKSLLPGELHSPLRQAKTARKSRQDKRKIVMQQAMFYAERWHNFNPQVARTEGVIATEDGLQHVVTFHRN